MKEHEVNTRQALNTSRILEPGIVYQAEHVTLVDYAMA